MALEVKMSLAEAKQDAKLMASFFRRFSRAEQVIDIALACENDVKELKGITTRLREEIKQLRIDRTDTVNSNKLFISSHKTKMDKLDSDCKEYKSTLETKMQEYTDKVAGEVSEIKASLATEQEEHDNAMKSMEEERDRMKKEVGVVRAQAEALQRRASGLV